MFDTRHRVRFPAINMAQQLIFVFQCKLCHYIVGDSSTLCAGDDIDNYSEASQTITLRKASNVTWSNVLMMSTVPTDMGSAYVPFKCQCQAPLGRIYKTTHKALDLLRYYLLFGMFFVLFKCQVAW